MPRFKSIIFYQYSPKINLVVKKKCKIFKRWGSGVAGKVATGAGFRGVTPFRSDNS